MNLKQFKALSVRQPWAWLIANGLKDIENRNWLTTYRGQLLIHAGKKFDFAGYEKICDLFGIQDLIPMPNEYQKGGIIGVTQLEDCVTNHQSEWFVGKYGFVLNNSHPIKFIPLTGKLMLFDVNLSLQIL